MKPSEIRIRERANTKIKKSAVPVTVLWQNSRMVRSHSIKAAVSEILSLSQTLDVIKINIVGNPSTGKSTLAKVIAHLLHHQAKIPFALKILTRKDLIDFSQTLSKLDSTMNWILVFDDISFLKSELSVHQINKLEKEFTEIRHLPGGKDVKIISIFNFHYTMAVSKYLRQSDFHFYTSVGSSDIDNLLKVVGKRHTRSIHNFIKIFHEAYSPKKQFTFQLGYKGKMFTYPHRKPFAPVYFFNGYSSRICVFPTRHWIAPHCLACSTGEGSNKMNEIDLNDLDVKLKKFGIGTIRQALRIKCLQNGIYAYPKRAKQALTFIDKWSSKNNCDLEVLLNFYNLKDEPTKLKLPKGFLDDLPPPLDNE